jgi:ribonuclease P protein component
MGSTDPTPRPPPAQPVQRIKQGREFAALRVEGQRLAVGCVLANWKRLPGGTGSRFAVVTSRRLGSAVVRNRARRLLREAFRRHAHQLAQPIAAVLVARSSIVGRKLDGVETDFVTVLRRAKLLRLP